MMAIGRLRLPAQLSAAGLFVLPVATLWAAIDSFLHLDQYTNQESNYLWVLILRWGSIIVCAIPTGLLIGACRLGLKAILRQIQTWLPIRLAVYSVLLAVACTSIGYVFAGDSRDMLRSLFITSLLISFSGWGTVIIAFSERIGSPLSGRLRLLDIACLNFTVVLLSLEFSIELFSRYSTNPIFWDKGAIESSLRKYRSPPGGKYFDFTFNSSGYHDTEFFAAEKTDLVVALLTDSFGLGVVPYSRNFATVAEKTLSTAVTGDFERVAIHNFGIPSIGMHHYSYLLETEVSNYSPNLVVLCVFAGNDISGLKQIRARRYCFQNWWVATIARRLIAIEEGRTEAPLPRATASTENAILPAYLDTPGKEPPHFSKEAFLQVEMKRLNICRAGKSSTSREFKAFFRALDYFNTRLGPRLLLVVIPDEFQVNDKLYEILMQRVTKPGEYDRDYPQKRISDYCRQQQIKLLDLLPVLREAEETAATYHRQDTHFNSHGNRVAGEAIGHKLAEMVKSDRPKTDY